MTDTCIFLILTHLKQIFKVNWEYLPDYKRFISGKYSQLTLKTKTTIIDFFAGQKKISNFVEGFLSPEDLHEAYANFLGVEIESIINVYEICTPPDLEKETLIDNNHLINQLLKRSSISLTK